MKKSAAEIPVTPLILRELTLADKAAFHRAREAFQDPKFTFALDYKPEYSFSEYLERLRKNKLGLDIPEGWVSTTLLFGFVGETIVGRSSIRHRLSEVNRVVGGHIGYGVISEHRRRGYATEMLRQSLPVAKAVGITRALLTCDDGNIGSQKTIESCGGILESVIDVAGVAVKKRRYWIDLA